MSKSDKGTTMLTNPIAYLSQIEDPRRQNKNLLHPLKNILTIALTGILCGYSDWVAIEDFASENQAWFASFLDLTNGIPSHDTFSNVMKRLNKDQINRYFSQWINHNAPKHKHIAIDGKFVQGSHHDNDNLQLVSAYASEAKPILAQTDINDKANEITTLPQLLSLIDIKGSTITADAMYCQKDTTKQIIKQGGNYILALKNNHKTLFDDVSLWLNTQFDNKQLKVYETTEKDHGRLETRRYAISTELDWLEQKDQWHTLNAVVMVESTRDIQGNLSTERRYYLSSLTDLTTIGDTLRKHWAIENSQHWVLDVIFGEDTAIKLERNEKANIALLTRTALNLIRANGDANLSVKRHKIRASQNTAFREKLLFGKFL